MGPTHASVSVPLQWDRAARGHWGWASDPLAGQALIKAQHILLWLTRLPEGRLWREAQYSGLFQNISLSFPFARSMRGFFSTIPGEGRTQPVWGLVGPSRVVPSCLPLHQLQQFVSRSPGAPVLVTGSCGL